MLEINVERKPSKCPVCGEYVVDIIYGTGDMTEVDFMLEYHKKGIMGGDNIPRRQLIWACSCGCKRFCKVNPDGTDAPDKLKLFKNICKASAGKINWKTSMVERDQYLPAPRIEVFQDSTKVTLFSEMEFSNIPMEDKLWSCYLHACLMYIQGDALTNKSLRGRFGIPETSSSSSSRLIREAIGKNLIKVLDPNTAPRYMKYIPIWA